MYTQFVSLKPWLEHTYLTYYIPALFYFSKNCGWTRFSRNIRTNKYRHHTFFYKKPVLRNFSSLIQIFQKLVGEILCLFYYLFYILIFKPTISYFYQKYNLRNILVHKMGIIHHRHHTTVSDNGWKLKSTHYSCYCCCWYGIKGVVVDRFTKYK